MRRKVSIIGAGNVGASTAYFLAQKNITDVTLIDVVEGMPQGKAMDFSHISPVQKFEYHIRGSNDYKEIANSDVVVHTAGIARKPGMDRMDLLRTNVRIARLAAQAIMRHCPNAVVIVVSNPLDVIAMAVLRESGLALRRVVGMAGILDSTRFRYFIAEALRCIPQDVFAMVLGGHGDTMVPLPRYTTVRGIPLTSLMDQETIARLVDRTRKGGAEIVNYYKTGSAFYAPAASASRMVEAVLGNQKKIEPASAYLRGEYGYSDMFLGVPVLLGENGVEAVYEVDLDEQETMALQKSAEAVQEGIELLNSID